MSSQTSKYHCNNQLILYGFLLVLLLSIFSSSNVAPTVLGDIAFLFTVVLFLIIAIGFTSAQFTVSRTESGLLLVIIAILFGHAFSNPSVPTVLENFQLLRVPIIVFFLLFSLYVVPQTVPVERAMWAISVVSAGIVLLGVPSLLLGPYSVLGVEFAPYNDFDLPFSSITVPAMVSFYADANAMSKIALFGMFSSGYLAATREKATYVVILFVTSFGLYMSHSRGAMLAAVAGFGSILLYRRGPPLDRTGIVLFIVASFVGYGMLFNLIPAPEVIPTVPLSSRGSALEASFEAITRAPMLGHGLQDPGSVISPYISPSLSGLAPQNTFVYMVLTSGLLGATAYLLFIIRAILLVPPERSSSNAILRGACISVFVIHFFSTVPLFSMNQSAFIGSLFFGYLLHHSR